MTTLYHTPIAHGAAATHDVFNAPLGQLDAAIAGMTGYTSYNVINYGAVGDGVADDWTAIQAAIDAAAVDGGTVVMPAGTYRIGQTLTMAGHVALCGELGSGTSGGARIMPSAQTFAAITVVGPTYHWRISDVIIDFNQATGGTASAVNTAIGIRIDKNLSGAPALFTIERVNIYLSYRGIQILCTAFMFAIRDCFIQTTYDYGYWAVPDASLAATTATLSNIYIQTAGGGFRIDKTNTLTMINCATDYINISDANANHFGTCRGQILGFFAEGCTVHNANLFLFSNCSFLVNGINAQANSFSSDTAFSSSIRMADAPCDVVLTACWTYDDAVTAGDHFHISSGAGATSVLIANSFGIPAGASNIFSGQVTYLGKMSADSGFQNCGANWQEPDVSAGNMFKTANTNPTTIINFTGGTNGQTIKLIIADAVTTIDFSGTTLKGNAGVDWTPASGDWMEATYDGSNWYCSVHDCTA